jgi:hypothetical protein
VGAGLGKKNRTGNEMNVLILGCGPAGLLAAHACALGNHEFHVYSTKRKSPIHGAQYIHTPIPGIHSPESPDGLVVYDKVGDRDTYAKKVYGRADVPVSWDKFDIGYKPAWSMQRTYDWLWEHYSSQVEHLVLSPSDITRMLPLYDLCISAIPAPAVCMNRAHSFHQTTIYILESSPNGALPMNTIVYNGRPEDDWYRACNLFGYMFTEYGHRVRMAVRGRKPIYTDCDCHGPKLVRVGRFGRWERGVLAHDGFERTERILAL